MIRRTLLAGVAFAALAISGSAFAASTTTTTAPTAAPTTTPSTTTTDSTTKSTSAPATTTGQYTTEADAKSACGSDLVVWANKKSKVYHYSGTTSYGKGKASYHSYMCQKDADTGGFHAAKNEKKPS